MRRPGARWPAAVVAGAGGVVWLLATLAGRGRTPGPAGVTPEAHLAAVARALPAGTSLDSARAFLRARGLDFAQGATAGGSGGSALVAVLPGGAGRLRLEFDARRRLTGQRVEAAGAPAPVRRATPGR